MVKSRVNTDDVLSRLLAGGERLEDIAKTYSVTRERIRQIGRDHGVKCQYRAVRRMRVEAKRAARDEHRARRDDLVAEARALVLNDGLSIRKAFVEVGLPLTQLYLLKGTPSRHGRWRPDLGPKIDKAIDLVLEGSSITAAAISCGISTVAVTNGFKRRGIERPSPLRRSVEATKAKHAAIAARYAENVPTAEIASEFGLSPQSIYYIAAQAGVRRMYVRSGGGQRRPRLPRKLLTARADASGDWPADRFAALIAAWNEGLSASAIAERLGAPATRNSVLGKIFRLRNRAEAA